MWLSSSSQFRYPNPFLIIGDVHELRVTAKPISHCADTAFQHGGHFQLAADLPDLLVLSLEREGDRAMQARETETAYNGVAPESTQRITGSQK